MSNNKSPIVSSFSGGKLTLQCPLCDKEGEWPIPNNVEAVNSIVKSFEKEHKDCGLKLLAKALDRSLK